MHDLTLRRLLEEKFRYWIDMGISSCSELQ